MAALAGAIGGLASGAAGIASLFTGSKSGGGGGGPINPISPILFALLGIRTRISSKGKVKFETIEPGSRFSQKLDSAFNTGVFDQGLIGDVRDFLDPLPLDEREVAAREIFDSLPADLQSTLNVFDEIILPGAQELATTGFRTDIQPIIDQQQRRFERETIPQLREQFAGQTGTFSSDFLNAITNAGADLNTELGALQVELDEAAASRRASGIPILSQLQTGRLGLPISVGNDLFQAGQAFRQVDESLRPGARQLNLLQLLGQQGSPSNLGFVANQGQPSQTSQILQGLSSIIPNTFSAFGGLGSNLGIGGGPGNQGIFG